MIEIVNKNSKLIAIYTPDSGVNWLFEKLNNNDEYYLKNTYKLTKDKIFESHEIDIDFNEEESIAFQIGIEEENFFKLDKDVFNININIFIDKNIKITPKFFTANKNISILSKLEKVIKESIYIVLDENYEENHENTNQIPISAYKTLLTTFPNNTELIKYSHMRIATALNEYFNDIDTFKVKYEQYLNNKTLPSNNIKFVNSVTPLKLDILLKSHKELTNMLKEYKSYNEKNWQTKIKDILCVLFPKYLYALREVDFGEINGYNKHPDFTLIDSNGYIDIMEIKKPDDFQIMRNCTNRNNNVPQKIFTDVIIQTTKYINALNQNHAKSKTNIIKKLKESEPTVDITVDNISINNPKGIILIGRSDKLTKEQRYDFELIKRQYKDITEIMTYDDLLKRLDNLIKKLKFDIES